MPQKIKLGDEEYEVDSLSDTGKAQLDLVKFASNRIQELLNLQGVLQTAKSSYLESLKKK